MYIYKLTRKNSGGYDTFDSAVVVAMSPFSARRIHPDSSGNVVDNNPPQYGTWVSFDEVEAEYIGEAKKDLKEGVVVVASFNAG